MTQNLQTSQEIFVRTPTHCCKNQNFDEAKWISEIHILSQKYNSCPKKCMSQKEYSQKELSSLGKNKFLLKKYIFLHKNNISPKVSETRFLSEEQHFWLSKKFPLTSTSLLFRNKIPVTETNISDKWQNKRGLSRAKLSSTGLPCWGYH